MDGADPLREACEKDGICCWCALYPAMRDSHCPESMSKVLCLWREVMTQLHNWREGEIGGSVRQRAERSPLMLRQLAAPEGGMRAIDN